MSSKKITIVISTVLLMYITIFLALYSSGDFTLTTSSTGVLKEAAGSNLFDMIGEIENTYDLIILTLGFTIIFGLPLIPPFLVRGRKRLLVSIIIGVVLVTIGNQLLSRYTDYFGVGPGGDIILLVLIHVPYVIATSLIVIAIRYWNTRHRKTAQN